jgi:hypothetical protein
MIKFFRKIRHQLLTKNLFSKYLLYAFGEIVLVVIGILIALQLNNLNEVKKTEKQLDLQLITLIKDLQKDVEQLSRIEHINIFRTGGINYLIKHTTGENLSVTNDTMIVNINWIPKKYAGKLPDTYDKELVALSILSTTRPNLMTLNLSVITEMKSIGLFAQIKKSNLKDDINNYYNELKWDFSDIKENREVIVSYDWQEFLRDVPQITLSELAQSESPIDVLIKYPKSIVYLKIIKQKAEYRVRRAKRTKKDAEDLIKKINAFLQNSQIMNTQ